MVGATCGRDFSVARDRAGPPVFCRRHEHASTEKAWRHDEEHPDEAHGTVGRHRSPGQVAAPFVVGARLLWGNLDKGENCGINPSES